MKSAFLTIHLDKNPPPQNELPVEIRFVFKSTGFTSSILANSTVLPGHCC
jgi:hypothetical protein